MASHPRLQHIYGFSLFDDLHNFMPELLYDDDLFRHVHILWMRSRVRSLFPREYAREYQTYRLYESSSRRREYEEWQDSHAATASFASPGGSTGATGLTGLPTATALPRASATLAGSTGVATSATASRGTTPLTVTTLHEPIIQSLNRSRENRIYTTFNTQRFTLADDLLGGNPLMQVLMNALQPTTYDDVVVTPTDEQIERNSRMLEGREVAPDTICSICQYHEYRSSEERDTRWRRLRCEHEFHRPCVDRWFTQSTYCPVCRNDIRIRDE